MGLFDFLLGKRKKRIAFFVDGPNIIRKQLNIDMQVVKRKLEKLGELRIARVYLDQFASDKLIEAMVNQGLEPKITTGDVDVTLAVEATEQVVNKDIDAIALMSRDTDFIPVMHKAKEHGKQTILVGIEPGLSVAMKNTADIVLTISKELKRRPRAQKISPKKNRDECLLLFIFDFDFLEVRTPAF